MTPSVTAGPPQPNLLDDGETFRPLGTNRWAEPRASDDAFLREKVAPLAQLALQAAHRADGDRD